VTKDSILPNSSAGYVCPSCRIIFSIPQDLGGNGVSCPGCEHLLTVPSPADKVSVLGASSSKYNGSFNKGSAHHLVKHRRVRRGGDFDESKDGSTKGDDNGVRFLVPIALLSVLLIGGLAYFLLSGSSERSISENGIIAEGQGNIGDGEEGDDEIKEEEVYKYDSKDDEQVALLEDFLTGFFAAKTIDEMLPYVIPVDNIREKMIKYYEGENISQSPFKNINVARDDPEALGYITFRSQTQDYANHTGSLKYSRDAILLDWESFVGYSEMTWDELAKSRPTKKVRVRVIAKRAFYYNEDFTDESKWQAVAMNSPNEEDSIYGYIEKRSAGAERLFNFGLSDNRKVVLDIHFPTNAKKGDQVFIDDVVALGWVVKEEK